MLIFGQTKNEKNNERSMGRGGFKLKEKTNYKWKTNFFLFHINYIKRLLYKFDNEEGKCGLKKTIFLRLGYF